MKDYQPPTCPKALRAATYKKYNYCCASCGCADSWLLTIDRADSDDGYKDYNVQCLCTVCNCYIKGSVSDDVLPPRIRPIKRMRAYNKNRVLYSQRIRRIRDAAVRSK